MDSKIDYNKLHWVGDYNGYELDYPNVNIVGHYTAKNLNLLIDTEAEKVLDHWFDEGEES